MVGSGKFKIGMIFTIMGISLVVVGLVSLSALLDRFITYFNETINEVIAGTIGSVEIFLNWAIPTTLLTIGIVMVGAGTICFAFLLEK